MAEKKPWVFKLPLKVIKLPAKQDVNAIIIKISQLMSSRYERAKRIQAKLEDSESSGYFV